MIQEVTPRSYQVEIDSEVMLRRNRRNIRLNNTNHPLQADLRTAIDASGETSVQVNSRNEGQTGPQPMINEQSGLRSQNVLRNPHHGLFRNCKVVTDDL